jgi:hypothetical protein
MRDALGPQVFTVETGPRLDDETAVGGALPAVIEPTLFVTHVEEWRGQFDGSITRPRGIWAEIDHHFVAEFVIPGDNHPLVYELDTTNPIPQDVIKSHPEGGTINAPLEEWIYGTMADEAFLAFEDKFTATVLPARLGAAP